MLRDTAAAKALVEGVFYLILNRSKSHFLRSCSPPPVCLISLLMLERSQQAGQVLIGQVLGASTGLGRRQQQAPAESYETQRGGGTVQVKPFFTSVELHPQL